MDRWDPHKNKRLPDSQVTELTFHTELRVGGGVWSFKEEEHNSPGGTKSNVCRAVQRSLSGIKSYLWCQLSSWDRPL